MHPTRSPFARAAALTALVLLLAAGCGAPPVEAPEPEGPAEETAAVPAAEAGNLEIRDPRASSSPAGTGAVYLTVADTGGEGDRLVGVSTPAAESATLHESVDQEGVHRMVERPEGFEVPAGGSLELAPGGKHVMLMGLADGAAADGSLPLTLTFVGAGEVTVEVPVAGPGGMDRGETDHKGMDHEGMDHGSMDHDGMEHGDGDRGDMEHDHRGMES